MSWIRSLVSVALLAVCAGCTPTPSQADVEKSIREEMKADLNANITAVNLTKEPDGGYTGTATADNGDEYDIIVYKQRGRRTDWKAVPSQAMAERIVREGVDEKSESKVKSLELTKRGPGSYSGTATLENGTKLNVSTKMDGKRFTWQTETGDKPKNDDGL